MTPLACLPSARFEAKVGFFPAGPPSAISLNSAKGSGQKYACNPETTDSKFRISDPSELWIRSVAIFRSS